MQKKKLHYAWWILAACCLMQSGIVGVVQNSRGVFFHPVCSELGIDTSSYTLHSLFQGTASFLFLPFCTKLLNRFPHRLVLGISAVLFTGATALMGSMSRLPGFYAAAFLQGTGGALLSMYICPLLIANWFDKFYGTAMGIFAAFSGLVGIFVNPILDGIITAVGWRNGYRIQGLIAFAFAFPAVLLIRALAPEDCGLTRYGESGLRTASGEEDTDSPVTPQEKRLILLMLAFTFFTSLLNGASQHFSNYAVSVGLSSATGALLVSCAMVGNIGGKFLAGVLGDRFGTRAAILCTYLAVGAGSLLMTAGNSPLLYPGAVLTGISMPISTVCVPMAAKYIYGLGRYRRFFARISMINILTCCFSVTLLGTLYDFFGRYPAVFLCASASIPICLILFFAADSVRKKA